MSRHIQGEPPAFVFPGSPWQRQLMAAKPTTYWDYIKVEELLSLQSGLNETEEGLSNDEVMFIVVHQIDELWFKLVLFELDSVRERLRDDDEFEASRLLQRVLKIEELLVQQIHILETMTPRDFLSFRAALKPASGFQSAQFRELEFISGMKEGGKVLKSMQVLEEEREQSLGKRRQVGDDRPLRRVERDEADVVQHRQVTMEQ